MRRPAAATAAGRRRRDCRAQLLLRLLDLGDGVAGLGEGDLIAGMQGVERNALHLELLHGAAAAACAYCAVLRLLNRDRAVEPVNLGDHPSLRVLRKGDSRTKKGEGSSGANGFRDCHGDLLTWASQT